MKYSIRRPEVLGNRVRIAWTPAGPFEAGSYTIEYPDFSEISASPGKLAEACFPLCLALAAVGAEEIRLPVQIDPDVLRRWRAVLATVQKEIFRRKTPCRIENGTIAPGYRDPTGRRDALFFGGGTESLVTLGLLRERGGSPILLTCGGPSWLGSDPQKNPHKFSLDETLASDLGLQRVRIFTSFLDLVRPVDWARHLRPGHWPMSSFLFTPLFVSLALPVCESLGIGRLVQGHEKMKDVWEFFAFSPKMTGILDETAHGVRYQVELGDRTKEQICLELHSRYAALAPYQYSCWKNEGERWCHACENCLRSFLFLEIAGMPADRVGLNPERLFQNRAALLRDTLRSPDCYGDEYWGYLWSHTGLRREPALKKLLDEIRLRAFFFKRPHDTYLRMPPALKRLARRLIRADI